MFSKFQSEEKKRLLSNFFSLSSLQIMNYILPLIIVPYLFSTLGAEKFGIIILAQSIAFYFGLLVNYGFNLPAIKEISINRENVIKVSEIYSVITLIKIVFFFLAFILYVLMIFSIDFFLEERELYLYSFGVILESILFPVWFFQGMERMKYITIIHTVSKIIFTGLIFILVKSENDYLYVPILYLLGAINSGVLAIYILKKDFQIRFIMPNIKDIEFKLKNGWHFFISNLGTNMYRKVNVVILGFMTSIQYVGYYALAEKIITAIQSLMIPITETLFPFITKRNANQSLKESLHNLYILSKYYLFILLITFIAVLFLTPFIVNIIGGDYIENVILDLRILSLVIIFGGLNYLLGIIGLIALGFQKYYMISVLFVGVLNIILCFVLVYFMDDAGAAISLTISELTLLFLFLRKFFILHKDTNETKNILLSEKQ